MTGKKPSKQTPKDMRLKANRPSKPAAPKQPRGKQG